MTALALDVLIASHAMSDPNPTPSLGSKAAFAELTRPYWRTIRKIMMPRPVNAAARTAIASMFDSFAYAMADSARLRSPPKWRKSGNATRPRSHTLGADQSKLLISRFSQVENSEIEKGQLLAGSVAGFPNPHTAAPKRDASAEERALCAPHPKAATTTALMGKTWRCRRLITYCHIGAQYCASVTISESARAARHACGQLTSAR